jgi:hypothetical protein
MKLTADLIKETKILGMYSKKHNCYVSIDKYFIDMDFETMMNNYGSTVKV